MLPTCRTSPHVHAQPLDTMPDHVLITGGAQRLGAELVRHFARAGWHVWCHHQRSTAQAQTLAEGLRAEGHAVDLVRADLAEPAAIEAMMASLAARGVTLRCVVNNASLFEPDGGRDFEPSQARRQLDVNLLAPMLLGRLLAQQQPADAAGHACVVHVLDQKVFNLNPDYFSYTVSKLALERAVALQAQALAPGVRVCGVAPGLLYLSGPQTAENFAWASRQNLLQRPIDPADVARTCLFLAQTVGLNGTTVAVDNGQHLVPMGRDVMFMVDEWMARNR